MGNLLILNGSPRAPRSNSRRYAQIFSSCYGENTEYFDITKRNHPGAVCQARRVHTHQPRLSGAAAKRNGVEMMRLFCRQNHYPFGSVLKIGSGEAILDSPFRFLAVRKIRRFAGSIAKGSYGTFQTTMPLPKGLFVKAAASYWNNYGKKFGVTKEEMQTMQIES